MLVVSVASVTVVGWLVVPVVELQSPLSVKMALTLRLSELVEKKRGINPTLTKNYDMWYLPLGQTHLCQWCTRRMLPPQSRRKKSSIPPSGPEMYSPIWSSPNAHSILL